MTLGEDVLYLTVGELGDRLRRKIFSPVELTRAYLDRIERVAPRLRSFLQVTADAALAEARRAEEELAAGKWRGPLHGIPYGVKDLLDTRGVVTSFGAKPYADRVPVEDATVVRRLREAGAVLLGKLSMIELCGGVGYSSPSAAVNGACVTPWDLTRWAGGSSSGPGAAVAAGLLGFAIGSETWGSIVCPAAWCGVSGLRPTYGLVPLRGAMPLGYTMDKLGPMARSAADCALVLAAIAGRDPLDSSTVEAPSRGAGPAAPRVDGLRAALIDLPEKPEIDPVARAAFGAALAVLRDAGVKLEPAELPDFPFEALGLLFWQAESRAALDELRRNGRWRELADRSSWEKLEKGEGPNASATDYVKGMQVRAMAQIALNKFFEKYDIIVSHNFPFAPPKIEQNLDHYYADWPDALGGAGNIAGLPALAVPCGFIPPGTLPLSLQIVGRPFDEAKVVAVGAAFQSRTDWHRRRPPLA